MNVWYTFQKVIVYDSHDSGGAGVEEGKREKVGLG